ncbi:hypothetical protein OU798_16050 [Prolixibacteraceae bacterium Z1-6]|uniref:Uncharacterized protein n=1 Tax=Draconibacterium aestuarii TaxID=2998507 RepID=A0A9X3FFP2_9BACT|nr:hypothetical protein [Prolixibacteraceae bacterium Z1-6]
MNEIITTTITLVSGGFIWEGFKFFYPEVTRYIDSRVKAKKTFYENLDPILKSSSELYGKLESLAKEDFSTFINPSNSNSKNPEQNKKYVLYLFSQFWACIEFLRLESQYTDLSKNKKGKQLLRFIETIESRKYRVLDRSNQRIIGECLILNKNQKFKIMTLNEFLDNYETVDSSFHKWVKTLENKLEQVSDKETRQLVLRFGVIVALIIDHFDPYHTTVRRRAIYLNKLSPKSHKMIKHSLLKHYLTFIKNKSTYYLLK